MQRGRQAERGRAVVEHAGDVGRQVHDVGQVEHERALGDVHAEAVRRQRVGDRADGELVLLEVLRRAGQGGGQREVVGVVAGTADGAGQDAARHQAALAADEHLRGGAEQAVDVERPARRVARRPAGRAGARTSSGSSSSATGRGRARPCRARPAGSGGPRRRRRAPSSAPLIAPSLNTAPGGRPAAACVGRRAGVGASDAARDRGDPARRRRAGRRRPRARPGPSRRARRRRRTTRRRRRPLPGSRASSRTTLCSAMSRHQRSASAKRRGSGGA